VVNEPALHEDEMLEDNSQEEMAALASPIKGSESQKMSAIKVLHYFLPLI
jgi:hypothetical protein